MVYIINIKPNSLSSINQMITIRSALLSTSCHTVQKKAIRKICKLIAALVFLLFIQSVASTTMVYEITAVADRYPTDLSRFCPTDFTFESENPEVGHLLQYRALIDKADDAPSATISTTITATNFEGTWIERDIAGFGYDYYDNPASTCTQSDILDRPVILLDISRRHGIVWLQHQLPD